MSGPLARWRQVTKEREHTHTVVAGRERKKKKTGAAGEDPDIPPPAPPLLGFSLLLLPLPCMLRAHTCVLHAISFPLPFSLRSAQSPSGSKVVASARSSLFLLFSWLLAGRLSQRPPLRRRHRQGLWDDTHVTATLPPDGHRHDQLCGPVCGERGARFHGRFTLVVRTHRTSVSRVSSNAISLCVLCCGGCSLRFLFYFLAPFFPLFPFFSPHFFLFAAPAKSFPQSFTGGGSAPFERSMPFCGGWCPRSPNG